MMIGHCSAGSRISGVLPWAAFALHRKRAGIMGFTVSQQVLYLEIQFARQSKEEIENWRQRSRNPSVPSDSFQPRCQQALPVDYGCDLLITSFLLACLSPGASRLCLYIADATSSVPLA